MNKLTIVVAIYNVEEYIEKCIKSLLNQDYDNYKILLINDGSSDNSEKICLEYQKKYPKIIEVHTKENGGLSSVRNYGIEHSNSEYIFFVDGDDYIEKNSLSKIIKKVEKKDILVFNYNNVYEKDNKIEKVNTYDYLIDDAYKRFLNSFPSACNKVFKLSLFKDHDIRFPEKLYYEDLATTPRLCQYAKKIVYDNNAYYNYLQRAGSIMHQSKYNKKLEDIFVVFNVLENELTESFKDKYKDEIEYMYIWHLLRNASLRFLDFNKTEIIEKIRFIIKNKYPNWKKNSYFKKYDLKRKILCYLMMHKQYKLIQILRRNGSDKKCKN